MDETHILPHDWNGTFHVTSIILHMLQVKGLYGGQAHEDPYIH